MIDMAFESGWNSCGGIGPGLPYARYVPTSLRPVGSPPPALVVTNDEQQTCRNLGPLDRVSAAHLSKACFEESGGPPLPDLLTRQIFSTYPGTVTLQLLPSVPEPGVLPPVQEFFTTWRAERAYAAGEEVEIPWLAVAFAGQGSSSGVLTPAHTNLFESARADFHPGFGNPTWSHRVLDADHALVEVIHPDLAFPEHPRIAHWAPTRLRFLEAFPRNGQLQVFLQVTA